MIPPPGEPELITRDALNRIEANAAANLQSLAVRLDDEIKHERELRELTERLGGEALKKASDFITEKTEEHNNLLTEMRLDRARFVSKEDMEKEKATAQKSVLFYISIAGFLILIIQNAIRYLTPDRRDAPAPVTITQPSNIPVPVKAVP